MECVDDRSLLIADHPHFLKIDADRRQIFRNTADVLILGVRPDKILPPITRSAAVTTSLEADELAVGMITCEMFKGQDSWSSTPDQRRASALRTVAYCGRGVVRKKRRCPSAGRGGGFVPTKLIQH